ncbi:unnamed protein product [Ophioblennius macclurei]
MNIILSNFSRLRGLTRLTSSSISAADLTAPHLRSIGGWTGAPGSAAPSALSRPSGLLSSRAEGSEVFQQMPWQYQQIRTKKRGMEYQPKNLKRKRTHGWIKRISTQGGIEVILRRMLKGRKSLTH